MNLLTKSYLRENPWALLRTSSHTGADHTDAHKAAAPSEQKDAEDAGKGFAPEEFHTSLEDAMTKALERAGW